VVGSYEDVQAIHEHSLVVRDDATLSNGGSMILCAYDIETTGLDLREDRMIEVGLVLYSTGQKKILESTGFLVHSDGVLITEEITGITGITQVAVDRFGYDPADAIDDLRRYASDADAIIGHNVLRFDKPITDAASKRLDKGSLDDKLWIDTMTDIPGVMGEQLITMCAKHGWVNPNQHSAEDDAKDVLKLISNYKIEDVVERAKSPTVVMQSHQDRENNADAKKFKFRWSPDWRIWWKLVKEMDLDGLANQVPFEMSRVDKEIATMLRDS
jgi:DNA polymerase III epsilon subunit-like protein